MNFTRPVLVAAVLLLSCAGGIALGVTPDQGGEIDRERVAGKKFRFSWKSDNGAGFNGVARLGRDGTIHGIGSANESAWEIDGSGRLLFRHADGRISTTYERVWILNGLLRFEGPFHFREGIVHILDEVAGPVMRKDDSIGPPDAARIKYSTQRFVYLDEGESMTVSLENGTERKIELLSVHEQTDSVIGLLRRADVRIAIDGVPLDLVCAPYVMPTEIDGLRIQADTTSGWTKLEKKVQLSVWDASDPIVDTGLFVFPLPQYRLFSLGMQAFNEPVHLGARDGDPAGQRFYHNYGVDFAAYEGRERVVACIDGEVVHADADQGTILFEDDQGFVVEYGHLDSIDPAIRPGARVARGQPVGLVGRRGASGNFSHLHVGTYLSRDYVDLHRNNRALNLYPWLVAAYLDRSTTALHAVARPHHTVVTGEEVRLDGTRSISSGAAIVSYRWVFDDGTSADGPEVRRTFEKPGQYTAALWIENEQGERDVDFCKIKVFSDGEPEEVIPALFMTCAPTRLVDVKQPVSFRIWHQGGEADSITVDFGDGTKIDDYRSYSEVSHLFATEGIHVVTASARIGRIAVARKIKVVVDPIYPGADETTPSLFHYFDWINSQYEGTTEAHTLVNLDFFEWLHDEFGMAIDIYSLDVGNVDDGPFTAGVGRVIPTHCGTLANREFGEQFPDGFGPLVHKARSFGCRLGIWLGPDGFGTTPEDEQARIDMMVGLCRDHDFRMFKLDSVAGGLRPEKQAALARALRESRSHSADLIVLNERIDLGMAEPYATTFLWEGAETYIDVFMSNDAAAPHHRAGALARETVPGMKRLIEDHGVCFSSCLDFWEDDLVLQAFNRSLIMAPQIYGSPWLLRDDEFPRFARLCNLHRRHRDLLVEGMVLPEERYGPHAVSRGDGQTRFLTLRNLTWEPVRYSVRLDRSIGFGESEKLAQSAGAKVTLRRFHPSERILGDFEWGSEVEVEVLPFRSCLLVASTVPTNEIGLTGCDYEIERDLPGRPVLVKLLGEPGTSAEISLQPGGRGFSRAMLDGRELDGLAGGNRITFSFDGKKLKKKWHRKLGELTACHIPDDAEALYEATCFAADSNALEVRSLDRAGVSRIPQVHWARHAFFEQPMFVNRGIWDRNLFDGDMDTFFIARREGGALRVDFGELLDVDEIVIRTRDREEHDLNPKMHSFGKDSVAEVSADLRTWTEIARWSGKGTIAQAQVPPSLKVRYLRVAGAPRRIAEVEAYKSGERVPRIGWRASNLFEPYSNKDAVRAWSLSVVLDEIPPNGYLAVPIHGRHGNEGAWAALRVDGTLVGAPDRSVSFPSNTWEYLNAERDSNYTYYFPLEPAMATAKLEIVVLGLEGAEGDVKPEAWLTAYPNPFVARKLVLE